MVTKGYCMKCRKKREMKNIKKIKLRGRNAIKGVCSVCGTNMFVFV